jgi:hypothetical protein
MHVLARFDLPYRLFEFGTALRALESDHMRISTCHRRMSKEEAAPDGWPGLGVVGETKPPGAAVTVAGGALAGSLKSLTRQSYIGSTRGTNRAS